MRKPTLEEVVEAYMNDQLDSLLTQSKEVVPEFIVSVNDTIIDEGLKDEDALLELIKGVPTGTKISVYQFTVTAEKE